MASEGEGGGGGVGRRAGGEGNCVCQPYMSASLLFDQKAMSLVPRLRKDTSPTTLQSHFTSYDTW